MKTDLVKSATFFFSFGTRISRAMADASRKRFTQSNWPRRSLLRDELQDWLSFLRPWLSANAPSAKLFTPCGLSTMEEYLKYKEKRSALCTCTFLVENSVQPQDNSMDNMDLSYLPGRKPSNIRCWLFPVPVQQCALHFHLPSRTPLILEARGFTVYVQQCTLHLYLLTRELH